MPYLWPRSAIGQCTFFRYLLPLIEGQVCTLKSNIQRAESRNFLTKKESLAPFLPRDPNGGLEPKA